MSYDDAAHALHAAIASLPDELGPDDPDALLSEWVLVTAWVDPSTGETRTVSCTAPGTPRHHVDGLLHTALFCDGEA